VATPEFDELAEFDALEGAPCSYCEGEWFVDVLEVWPDTREFSLDSCCEESYAEAVEEMRDWDRKDWAAFLGARAGVAVRQVITEPVAAGSWTLDWGLELREVTFADAREFVGRFHRHNQPPRGWRWGHAIYNGPDMVAVCMVGRPVARMIDGTTTVEVNRLCVDPTVEPGLVWNACSMLYGAAARTAEARGYSKVITYTLETEAGTSPKAAGFFAEATTRGGSWNRPGRGRADTAPTCKKIRWARTLRPKKVKQERDHGDRSRS
jgi:hypothetical protein